MDKIRIAKVGGRFLVFDVVDVARLRREQSMCAILVGITPQAPNQTVFSSLPLELTAYEARWLVHDRGAAYVVDDRAAHLSALAGLASPDRRRRYLDCVDGQQQAAQALADEMAVERERRGAAARAQSKKANVETGSKQSKQPRTDRTDRTDRIEQKKTLVRIVPTTSAGLVDLPGLDAKTDADTETDALLAPSASSAAALRAHLADRGYYTTPGLRFGGQLSVYPGDPFRYHAHFVANSYGWDEPICLLDLVGTGRLATGVKKGLLIGGVDGDTNDTHDTHDTRPADRVRTFTMEWAAI